MKKPAIVFFVLALMVVGFGQATASTSAATDPGYVMRYADINDDNIVFTYEDDLWLVPAAGGNARRITSHVGVERYAKFSPNGKQLAFSAEYDGGYDIYVMDVNGGVPRRLTFHPSGAQMLDWCPDGTGIYFRSNREAPGYLNEIYRIPVEGGMPQKFPIDSGALASVAPDRSAVAYNRLSRETRTWKRYEGGLAQDIWIATFATGEIEKITEFDGSDNYPMWVGDTVYFNSDRNNATLNIFGYNTKTKTIKAYTNFDNYDVKVPSAGANQIVFQHGPGLKVLDLRTGQANPVNIHIPSDRRHVRTELITPAPRVGSFCLSPAGERVLIEARGEILNMPADEGDPVNLTGTSGSREKNASWSPDGRWVAFVSDKSGEEQLYLVDQLGQEPWRQLTDGFYGYTRQPVWSPDSKHLIFSDKFMRLHLVDVDKAKVKEIAHSNHDDAWERWGIMDYVWSPDSKWVAYTSNQGNMNELIFLYNLKAGESHQVTDYMATSWSPSFDPDGKFLYFLSNRTFNPIMGRQDQNHIFLKMALPYMVLLDDSARSPFHKENVVVAIEDDDDKDEKKDTKENVLDTAGLAERIIVCPGVEPGNYFRLTAIDSGFLMLDKPDPEFLKYQNVDDHSGGSLDLFKYKLDDESFSEVLGGIANYHLSADGKKLVYRAGNSYGVVGAGSKASVGDGSISFSNIKLRIDRLQEFPEIFAEAWRIQRDWFYDKDMHGVDWQAMYDKYAPFVAGCGTRGDLNYLIGEMISELNIGHTYIFGGDHEDGADNIRTGLLGCSFTAEKDSDYYRISDIVPGVSWDPRYRSPLTEPGIGINEGDYLIAIDGEEIRQGDSVYAKLVDKGNRMISLTTNSKPKSDKATTIRLRTLRSERRLRYRAWVDKNLDYVTDKSDGRIAYIHVPDMGRPGLVEFGRSFYPQTGKEALIIDDRFNGGGFVGDMIIDRLERELWSMTKPREGDVGRDPERVLHGPIVVLINECTYSNGEFFAEAVKIKNVATVMGVRTWGGSTGIEAHQNMVDGGGTTPPQFGLYGLDNTWPIEGWGVEPNIVVINMPADIVAGKDTQLDAAITHLLTQLANSNGKWDIPEVPPHPVKAKPRMSHAH